MKVIQFQTEKKNIRKFLSLPSKLYTRKEITQNLQEEKRLLLGTHTLSHYFSVRGFLVLDEREKPLARCMVTLYPGEQEAFLGFFESVEDKVVSKLLFDEVHRFCREKGREKIIGPVDASFWIRYRFKVNYFGRPYACEPYNKSYYPSLFELAGYHVRAEYFSNMYGRIPSSHSNAKHERRFLQMKERGYIIKNPEPEEFEESLREIYRMMIHLYSNFPAFRFISEQEFMELFSSLRYILKYDMVFMAYYKGKAVGFFVGIPDYANLIYGKLTPLKLWRVQRIKRQPQRYIMLYMGVEKEHLGLGTSLAYISESRLQELQAESVGALIQKGKVTGHYFQELIEEKFDYVLYEREVLKDYQKFDRIISPCYNSKQ